MYHVKSVTAVEQKIVNSIQAPHEFRHKMKYDPHQCQLVFAVSVYYRESHRLFIIRNIKSRGFII